MVREGICVIGRCHTSFVLEGNNPHDRHSSITVQPWACRSVDIFCCTTPRKPQLGMHLNSSVLEHSGHVSTNDREELTVLHAFQVLHSVLEYGSFARLARTVMIRVGPNRTYKNTAYFDTPCTQNHIWKFPTVSV